MKHLMQPNRWSLHGAKTNFRKVVAAALRGRPQLVTRWGREAIVILSSRDYEAFKSLQRSAKPSFKDYLLMMPVPADTGISDLERIPLAPRDIDPRRRRPQDAP
jgi:antitoxin Phd